MRPETRSGNIVLEGYIDVPADRIDAVGDALPIHIELTRAETGCRYFDVVPDPNVERRFLVNEIFEDRSAFDGHQQRAGQSAWATVTVGIERHYIIKEIV